MLKIVLIVSLFVGFLLSCDYKIYNKGQLDGCIKANYGLFSPYTPRNEADKVEIKRACESIL